MFHYSAIVGSGVQEGLEEHVKFQCITLHLLLEIKLSLSLLLLLAVYLHIAFQHDVPQLSDVRLQLTNPCQQILKTKHLTI